MAEFVERAPAKINLTLRVLGRRADGYHALDSLVVFADVSDVVTLDTAHPPDVRVAGPFASSIAGGNILARTLEAAAAACPDLKLGRVLLDKQLPVAAGLGGGSSDAAALLRAIRRANPDLAPAVDWAALAGELGADVPACLAGAPLWMSGRGERVLPLERPLPTLFSVLANPLTEVPPDKTARVFRALGAPPIHGSGQEVLRPDIPDRGELLALLQRVGNDLEAPAQSVVPEAGDVLDHLALLEGVEVVQMSGAGPTSFAILPSKEAAEAAARKMAAERPGWWVRPARLG